MGDAGGGLVARGSELFEKTASRDAKLAAWHWKEAAAAWQKAGDKGRAIAAARASERSAPEARSDILAHSWHRGLADVFFEAGEFGSSIPHDERAIEKTTIDGYRKECEQRLSEAKRRLSES